MIEKPRTFAHFPKQSTCPVCGTSEDAECLLVPIDGTQKDRIAEAVPVHLWCAVAKQFQPAGKMLYRWAEHGWRRARKGKP